MLSAQSSHVSQSRTDQDTPMADNDSTPMPVDKKTHQCSVCGKDFSRQDHLRRHSLSRTYTLLAPPVPKAPPHPAGSRKPACPDGAEPLWIDTGGKPYSCLFCRQDFARSDRLRDHYLDCPARGDREIPQKTQRGRRRRACAACTASKLRCDGGTPCRCCQRRNLHCDVSRVKQADWKESPSNETVTIHHSPAVSESSDTSSIKALVDGGTRGFVDGFNLPRVSDIELGPDSASVPSETTESDDATIPSLEHLMGVDFDVPGVLDFPVHMADLWVGPLGQELPYFAENGNGDTGWSGHLLAPDSFQNPDNAQLEVMQGYKADSPEVTLLKDMMLFKAREVYPDAARFDEVSAIIQAMFCWTKVDGFVRLFFQNFYPSCPIFHIPTFNVETIAAELLLAIFCFGAMYAHDGTDRLVADNLLDVAELLIFSTDVFTDARSDKHHSKEDAHEDEADAEWRRFERLQAGYLIVTLQYWAGTRKAKAHVMESRFCEVITAARNTGLTQVSRVPQDRISEDRWIRKEIKLRTMCMIRSLDCAFLFYSNYPCRLTLGELNTDLPCETSVFNSEHPFAEPEFAFGRSGNLASVFNELFLDPTSNDSESKIRSGTRTTQTIMDLFLSIHLLYVFVHSHLQLRRFMPLSIGQRRQQREDTKLKPGQAKSDYESDEISSAVETALKRWHMMCAAVCAKANDASVPHSGLFKLSYNFWLIIHLFVDKSKSRDLARSIDVQGEDKLVLLKSLVE